ncbi:MAG: right-handed parallel beta-helix repeat-containing protein, partial [Bacteroidota bacterium]|nr:right-handed parallel beta-helix repeat-containing protein [Bacteroidota bacterium]
MKYSIVILSLFLCFTAKGINKIDVTKFGITPNSFTDATSAIKKAIKECNNDEETLLSFPKGRYDFWSENAEIKNYFISNTSSEEECPSKLKKVGLLFENKKNLTIDGNGSLFVFHGKMITWVLDHCENIKLQNIHIDFERPSMSEMTFKQVTDTLIEAEINQDSRYTIIDNKFYWYGEGWGMNSFHAIIFNPALGTSNYSSWNPFLKSEAITIASNRVRFKGDFKKYNFIPGQTLTVRDPLRDQVGAFINHSRNISLKNVFMHYMHGLGIVNQFSENLHYDSVFVMPRPESGRVISSFADCIHFSGCKGQILIENCRMKGAHDDPINVHGTHLQVIEIPTTTSLKVRFMHPQSYGFEAFFKGDTVALVHSAKLQIFNTGILSSAKLINSKEMLLEFDKPLPKDLVVGDCIENLTWTPSLTIRNCRIEGTNTRGILVTTRKPVLIENNTFYRTGMHAILIANDASSWYESGEVNDVTIHNNTFEECGYNSAPGNYVIAILPENHELIKGYCVHKNIRIENNTFKVYDYPILTVKSTEGLIFKGNKVIHSDFMKPQGDKRPEF